MTSPPPPCVKRCYRGHTDEPWDKDTNPCPDCEVEDLRRLEGLERRSHSYQSIRDTVIFLRSR